MNLEEITNSIKEKLGDEETAKISDDIANILVFNNANEKSINDMESEIQKLKDDKEMLIQANGNLLLQVPQGREKTFDNNPHEEDKKPLDFRTLFDENGRLKR